MFPRIFLSASGIVICRHASGKGKKAGWGWRIYAILTNMKLALKITPQRSTQYTNMTETLALPELLASPLSKHIQEVTPATLGGQHYLIATVDEQMLVEPQHLAILSRLGATSE